MIRRLTLSLAAFALVLAACGDDTGESTTSTSPATTTTTVAESTSTSTTTTVAPTTAPTTTEPPQGGDAGDDVDDVIEELIAATESVRGLAFLDPPTVTVLSDEELAERVRADVSEELDPEEVAVEEGLYRLLGLIGPELDLVQAYTDLYAEQVLGFYDHETGELVVAGSAEPTPLTKVIVVHELIHALTDQHFAFGAIFDELREVEAYHEASALQSLVEGDATYFQIVYLQSLPVAEQFEAARESLAADMSVLEALPAFIGADLGFPYDTGFRFVERIVTDQGIGGVDQAYELLPTTTEQIIRPEAYFTLEPALGVDLSGVDLPAWELELEGELGQWNVQNYLLQGVDGGARVIAGDGWGGDWYKLYRAGENTAFAYRFEGDTPRDAQELFDALVVSLGETMDVRAPQISEPGADDDPAVVPSTAIFRGGSYLTIERLGRTVVLAASTDETAHSILADQLSLD